MPFEIAIDSAARVLRARYTGEVGLDERASSALRVLQEAERTGIYRWLLDFRGAHARVGKSVDVMRMWSEFASKLPPDARLAYLMTYDHQVDDAVGAVIRSGGVEVERFTNPGGAVAWLLSAHSPQVEATPADTDPDGAYRLVADAIDPAIQLSPSQFAALGELAQELLARGSGDAVTQRLVGRLSGVMGPGSSE